MSVSIEIPSIFALYADSRTIFEAEGKTVGECLQELGKRYPDLVKMIVAPSGNLFNSIEIFINGESAYPGALARPVKDGDKIKVIMIIQGG